MLAGILAVIVFYVFVPNRLYWTVTAGLYTAIAFTWLIYMRTGEEITQPASIGLMFLVANILGYITVVRLRFHRRHAFLDRENLIEEIAKREAANQRLDESQKDFSRLFDATPLPLILVSTNDGSVIKANNAATQFFRTTNSVASDFKTSDFLPSAEQRRKLANQLKQHGEVRSDLVESVNSAGDPVWGLVSALPVRFGNRNTSIVVFADVTEQMEIAERLRNTEKEFQTILNNMPDVFYRTDAQGFITMISPACIEAIGYTPEELIGTKMVDLYVEPEQRGKILEQLVAAKGKSTQVEAFMKRKDGKIVWISTKAFLRMDENGTPTGVEGIARDLTDKKDLENSLRSALDEAGKANKAKTKFLAAASHDLRQPLQTLMLYAGVLERRIGNGANKNIVAEIESGLATMSELLNALLDISKLEAGAVEPNRQPFLVSNVLDRMRARFAPVAANEGLRLKIISSSAVVESDPVLLENILGNLVGNAVRYTSEGKILIGCRRRSSYLDICVIDTGIGISDQDKERIFDDFYQVGNPGSDRKQGLGLGLPIVLRTAKLLGHDLTWHSEEGRGTSFLVSLPLGKEQVGEETTVESKIASPASSKILLIDDDKEVLSALSAFLRTMGNETLMAPSEQEALRVIDDGDQTPDIIIADYRLADGKNGADAVNAVRERLGKSVPAIIITGDTAPERIKQIKASGLSMAHKPINHENLLKLIAENLIQES